MVKFGTLEYYKLWSDALNKDEEFTKSGISMTSLYIFTDVLNPDGSPKAFFIRTENGKNTEVREAKASELDQVEFGRTATYAMHAGVAKGEINVQKSKLKLNMMKAMKNQKALGRLLVTSKELKDVEY